MPNRIIKESIHTSDTLNELTDFQFRLWVGLLTYVDDYGRGDARLPIIKGTVFPLRDRVTLKDIDAALKALAGAGCVGLYEVDGKPYLYFPTWESHQNIRNKKSKFPAPSDGKQITNDSGTQTIEINCKQVPANVPVIQSESESESEIESVRPQGGRRSPNFKPPTVDEVKWYCRDRHNNIDPETFVDFYSSKGWKIGKEPMKDWKAAVRTWEKRNREQNTSADGGKYMHRQYSDSDFKAMEVDLDAAL